MRIAHLTTTHTRYDTRIFKKECSALAESGYDVHLVVADGKADEIADGIRIFDAGASKGRWERMLASTKRVRAKAMHLESDIYHVHDPELLPTALDLKRAGKTVIFDAHEDFPKQLLTKPYLIPVVLRALSKTWSFYEKISCPQLDAVVAATPFIRDKFLRLGCRCVDVNNYAIIGELDAGVPWPDKRPEISYVGGITEIRGVRELVAACHQLKSATRLNLVGPILEPALGEKLRLTSGWERVNAFGVLGRREVRDVLGRSIAGVVTFHPVPNHVDAQPNKMFEYMSSGLPVIASDFPLWRQIIEGSQCGLCVDPLDPQSIAAAIDYLTTHPDEARAMGENGRIAVQRKYNWGREAKKLVELYRSLGSQ